MSEDDFKPYDAKFLLPEKFLDRLYEITGQEDSSKGFIVCYVDDSGAPMVYTKSDNRITEMGLRKALEEYLDEYERTQIIDLGGEKGPEDST